MFCFFRHIPKFISYKTGTSAKNKVIFQPVGYVNSEGWKPTLNVVGTNNEGGWPTPYARAANTAFLLSELPATSNFAPVSRVQSMALATTLGILRPKLIDLSKGGSFERALLNAEPSVGLFWARSEFADWDHEWQDAKQEWREAKRDMLDEVDFSID